jgi:hypothetical protein
MFVAGYDGLCADRWFCSLEEGYGTLGGVWTA